VYLSQDAEDAALVGRVESINGRNTTQPSNIRTVFNCFCQLSEIIHNALYTLHCPAKPVTSRAIIEVYKKYLHWYEDIPAIMRLGQNFTPQVLFVQ